MLFLVHNEPTTLLLVPNTVTYDIMYNGCVSLHNSDHLYCLGSMEQELTVIPHWLQSPGMPVAAVYTSVDLPTYQCHTTRCDKGILQYMYNVTGQDKVYMCTLHV